MGNQGCASVPWLLSMLPAAGVPCAPGVGLGYKLLCKHSKSPDRTLKEVCRL